MHSAGIARRCGSSPIHPKRPMNLGVVLSDLGEFEEALHYTRESLRLAPDSPDSHVNLGMTLARLGKRDEALKSYERAPSLNPELPEAHRNRAYIWLARGDFERGWPEYEWRLRCKKLVTLKVDSPRWNGEPIKGRSILLYAEQGLGDVLQFIRFAALVKERGGRVVVACAEPLLRLVAGCPGVDRVVDWKSTLPASDSMRLALEPAHYPGHDAGDPACAMCLISRPMLPRSTPGSRPWPALGHRAGEERAAPNVHAGHSKSALPGKGIASTRLTGGAHFHSSILSTWRRCPACD